MTPNWCRQQPIGAYAARWLLVVSLLVPFSGCGNNLADVGGTVTLDGQPLRGGGGVRATVVFQPVSANSSGAVGIVDENGRYQLSTGSEEGAAPGDYLVTCSATQIIPSKQPGGTPSGRRITDPKYANAKTSGLQFTVQPGDNEFNIPLESRPSRPSQRLN
ncbi:MAG: hypothetical protein WD738_13365 [Pirellulales bacterium]